MGRHIQTIKTLEEAKAYIKQLRVERSHELFQLRKQLTAFDASVAEAAHRKSQVLFNDWQREKSLLLSNNQKLLAQLADADKTIQLQRDYIVDLEQRLTEQSGVIGWFKRTFTI